MSVCDSSVPSVMFLSNHNHWLVMTRHVSAQEETFDELFAHRRSQVTHRNEYDGHDENDLGDASQMISDVQRR